MTDESLQFIADIEHMEELEELRNWIEMDKEKKMSNLVNDLAMFNRHGTLEFLWHHAPEPLKQMHGAWAAIQKIYSRPDLRPKLIALVQEACQE